VSLLLHRLLEGIELYKEDWEKIASHVGKSQSACLTHFVRLPIEDPYIDDLIDWTETAKRYQQQQRQSQQQQQQQLPPLPFLDEPNPIMSTLGTLSNIMGPKVAAAAAQAALQVLAEQDLKAGAVLSPEVRLAAVLSAAKQDGANGVQHTQGMNGVGQEHADQQQQQNGDAEVNPQQPLDRQLIASAVAAGLAAAATRAKQLAMAEEREIQRLMVSLTHDAARRVDAKVTLLMQLMEPPVSRRG
jgi:SWI/SNF related-matrix-associated actin-dependent regulator of chromatin subfamily C